MSEKMVPLYQRGDQVRIREGREVIDVARVVRGGRTDLEIENPQMHEGTRF